ncbi:4-oxalocrotonate decarboxylase [Alcanivorax sp. N3-2A]|nr:4-oxalocrotonate decarboxylase [Alcanivorax sp. N3-2A]|tara:strand:- start:28802 stop:29569 length:768 start_codon:yes stop_codon:yes gene_type:complete
MTRIDDIATRLDEAAFSARAVAQIDPDGELPLADAYEIQRRSVARRLARGERPVGIKMGFTSRAKMIQMGVDDVIWGRLTSGMQVDDGGTLDLSRFIHPRVEPELAFVLKRPLSGHVSPAQALAAVEAVAPALEIIDSRYQDFKFSLSDVIADNASSSGFVVGPWADPRTDLANLGMVMSFDGVDQELGSSAALLGHPLRALAAAARVAGEAEEPLPAGAIVMAGAATSAQWLRPGIHVQLEVERLGRVGFHVGA